MRYRSFTPPMIGILVLSSGITGCDTPAKRERARVAEDAARRKAEIEPPTPEVLSQVTLAVQAFMKEHHPSQSVEGCSLTSLTPNLFLVGVTVRDSNVSGPTIKQLTAERLRDTEEGWFSGKPKENGELLWVIDYLDQAKMKTLATRHGLEGEVETIRRQDQNHSYAHSWGHRSWLDDYLLWHFLFRRPAPMFQMPGGAFQPRPMGFRFHDPTGSPIRPEDARPYQTGAAGSSGRSSVFLGGGAWRPPLVSQVGHIPGQAFMARGSGVSGSVPMGTVSRGGFGAAGRAAGASSGG